MSVMIRVVVIVVGVVVVMMVLAKVLVEELFAVSSCLVFESIWCKGLIFFFLILDMERFL